MSKMSQISAMIDDGASVNSIATVIHRWGQQRGEPVTFGQCRYAARKMIRGRSEQ